jgi:hypothetical protein
MKRITLLFLVVFFNLTIKSYSAFVSGMAFLDNSSNHSDILIKFIPVSPSAIFDSCTTISNGSYSITIPNGIYDISYSKAGYQTYLIEEIFIDSDLILDDVTLNSKPTKEIYGSVYGTFFSDTAYIVTGYMNINNEAILTIEPGTEIKFDGYYSFTISGKLLAMGLPQSPITFTSNAINPATGDWAGIHFSGTSGSILSNVILEYGGGPNYSDNPLLEISNSNLLVDSCRVQYSNEAGIKITGGIPVVRNSNLSNIEGWALRATGDGSGKFYNNKIYDCGPSGALILRNGAIAEGNWVFNNSGAGILCAVNNGEPAIVYKNVVYGNGTGIMVTAGGTALISYNTIYNNDSEGIGIEESTELEITGNIICANSTGIEIEDLPTSSVVISYNLFENDIDFISAPLGVGTIITNNQNETPCDTYYNIFANPEFYSTVPTDSTYLFLKESSPAIDAGNPTDLDPDSTIRDLGAITYVLISSVEQNHFGIDNFAVHAYPNPFNNSLCFEFDSREPITSELKIYDISGNLIKVMSIDQDVGQKVYWNAKDYTGNEVSEGTYIYRIGIDSGIIIKK